MEDVEWINEDEVDQDCIQKESHDDNQVKLETNIITDMEKWLEQQWSPSKQIRACSNLNFTNS